MEVHLTRDQEALISQAIDGGRIQRKEGAVLEAMSLWEERERRRLEICARVDRADASLARGDGRKITHAMTWLNLLRILSGVAQRASPPNRILTNERVSSFARSGRRA